MTLTATQVKNFKPEKKMYRRYDEKGLYLQVATNGSKYWRYKFRFEGKEKHLALGSYPDLSLSEAREAHHEARRLVQKGINPIEERQRIQQKEKNNTFGQVASEWLAKQKQWKESHRRTVVGRLNNDILPTLGNQAIDTISPTDVLSMLRKIEARGKHATVRKVKGICSQIFSYAIASCLIEHNPTANLSGALTPVPVKHFAAITDKKKVGALMRAIKEYDGTMTTRCLLLMTAYTFTRQGELRHAEWAEINFEERLWIIPAEKTKRNRDHMVPLSTQSLDVLSTLHQLTGNGKYLFPSRLSDKKPASDNTSNTALRRMDYTKDVMTAHGFRTTASTLLNEEGYRSDVIEMQLAHVERNKVRAAYNRAQYLSERIQLMQDWADMLTTWENNAT